MDDSVSPKRKIEGVKEQNLFGSGYAGLGFSPPEAVEYL
jgi:hypothetical protein